ncbi:hypothetical protein [Acinetobacter sp. WZC-1]
MSWEERASWEGQSQRENKKDCIQASQNRVLNKLNPPVWWIQL